MESGVVGSPVEHVRTQQAQVLLAGGRDAPAFLLPLTDRGRLDAAELRYGVGATQTGDYGFRVHAPSLGPPNRKVNRHTYARGPYALHMLKDRLKSLLDENPGLNQTGLARACGIKPPSVNDWFSGKTKTLKGQNLLRAAAYFGVNAEWLSSGRGEKWVKDSPQAGEKSSNPVPPSHLVSLDPDIVFEALTLLRHDEQHAGPYKPRAEAERLAYLLEWVIAEGGRLSNASNRVFWDQVAARQTGVDGDGRLEAGRRTGTG